MVKVMIEIDDKLDKNIKQFMLDTNVSNKEKAIVKILEDRFGGKKK